MTEKISVIKKESIKLSDAQVSHFIKIISSQLGITIHKHQLNDLHHTIINACIELNCSPEKYISELENSPYDSVYHKLLIKGITIGETYFFRDKNQIQLLEKTILPEIIQRKRESKTLSLSIWSAGCASGEEIYTIAMILDRLLIDKKQWTLNLLGTDINIDSLKKAMQGIYGEWSMRSIIKTDKEHYFTYANNRYQLIDSIKQLVRFNYLNLNDNAYPSVLNETNAQDLILCRNVLIYFDTKSAELVIRKLSQSLIENGYLMLGASDPITVAGINLEHHFLQGTYFKKVTQKPIEPIPKPKSISTIRPKKIIAIEPQPIKVQTASIKLPEPAKSLPEKAIEYANQGQLAMAEQCCKESLLREPTSTQAHFTLAMIYLEMNKIDAAEDNLRKVLFLNKNDILAHYQLGLLLIRNKKIDSGIKSLRNAWQMVKKSDPKNMVPGFAPLTFGEFEKILTNELALQTKIIDEKNI